MITDRLTRQRTRGPAEMVFTFPIRCRQWVKTVLHHHDHSNLRFAEHYLWPEHPLANGVNWRLSAYLHQSGFTIVELLIAIAIAAVLATIAVPNVLDELPKYRLNGATRQVIGDLMAARMKAVSHNRRVKIFFTGDNNYKICDDANNDGIVDDCEGESRLFNIETNFKGVSLNSNNNPIFHPRGTASNLATISITNSSGTKSITIAITGRIQMI